MTQLYRLDIKDGAFTFTPHAPDAAPVRFCSPVTGVVGEVWGGAWFDATGYATYYEMRPGVYAYHTGVDLNLPAYADAGKSVYATYNGVVVFAGTVQGWQGSVVVIEHVIDNLTRVWTRYAHITDIISTGAVMRGQQLGIIADYNKDGAKGDHLHYDVIKVYKSPGHWPGANKAELDACYINPTAWHEAHA